MLRGGVFFHQGLHAIERQLSVAHGRLSRRGVRFGFVDFLRTRTGDQPGHDLTLRFYGGFGLLYRVLEPLELEPREQLPLFYHIAFFGKQLGNAFVAVDCQIHLP